MEFLDPAQKRKKTLKLFSVYFLVGFAILVATFVLILLVQGYNYKNKKGVVQNGLVFVESKPVSGQIWVNGHKSDNTSARLILNEGEYNMKISADGYRDWAKNFNLLGGSVRYFTYPRLIPNQIKTDVVSNYSAPPDWATNSPDRHWLLYKLPGNNLDFGVFDTSRPTEQPVNIQLPADAVKVANKSYGHIKYVEWSDDNKHLLLLQTLDDGQLNYITLDREKPENSTSISKKLGLQKTQTLSLKDKKWDKYFVLDSTSQQLAIRELASVTSVVVAADKVITYKSYGNDLILYTTYDGAPEGKARVLISDKGNLVNLQLIAKDNDGKYQLEIARFDGDWMYTASSATDNRVYIYQNPLSNIAPGSASLIKPLYSLRLDNPQFVSFSDNARFISMQSGNNFVVYDGELKTNYRYSLPNPVAKGQKATWLDGHSMSLVIDNNAKIFEFDGANSQTLTASLQGNGLSPYFDRDYNFIFTFLPLDGGRSALASGALTVTKK